ncbi:MAG: hypothetical protein ACJ8AW_08880 [Rhodopila sp.]
MRRLIRRHTPDALDLPFALWSRDSSPSWCSGACAPGSSLQDLSKMFLIHGTVFNHKTVGDYLL